MPTSESSSRNAKVSDLWSCLEPYAQLAQMLLPRMTGLTVLNSRGDVLWSNEVVAPDEPQRVAEATRRIEQAVQAGLPPHTLMQRAGLKMAHIPYKSTPQIATELASAAGGYVTGQTIVVDGGQTLPEIPQ